MLGKVVTPAAFGLSFLSQLMSKDLDPSTTQGRYYQNADIVGKIKMISNDVTGRVTGLNAFPDAPNFKQTINPAGVVNKYTGMGLGLLIYSHVAPRGMGGKGLARKVGKGLFWGGVIGGFFDPATGARAAGGTQARALSSYSVPGQQAGSAGSRVTGFGGTYSS